MTVGRLVEILPKLRRIDEVAIVGEADAIRGVCEERLGLCGLLLALGWVAKMGYPHGPWPVFVVSGQASKRFGRLLVERYIQICDSPAIIKYLVLLSVKWDF